MRTITTEVYQYNELDDKAKERARDWYRDITADETHWRDEMIDSMKKLFKVAGVKLTDWSIGGYSYSRLSCEFNREEIADLKGGRAFAWLENNLLGKCRMTREKYLSRRKDYFGYGRWYRPGAIMSCPFTGSVTMTI